MRVGRRGASDHSRRRAHRACRSGSLTLGAVDRCSVMCGMPSPLFGVGRHVDRPLVLLVLEIDRHASLISMGKLDLAVELDARRRRGAARVLSLLPDRRPKSFGTNRSAASRRTPSSWRSPAVNLIVPITLSTFRPTPATAAPRASIGGTTDFGLGDHVFPALARRLAVSSGARAPAAARAPARGSRASARPGCDDAALRFERGQFVGQLLRDRLGAATPGLAHVEAQGAAAPAGVRTSSRASCCGATTRAIDVHQQSCPCSCGR